MIDGKLEKIRDVMEELSKNMRPLWYIGTTCIGLGIGTLLRETNSRDIEVKTLKDYNKDGMGDILVDAKKNGETKERYLFLGQRDGTFIKLKEFSDENIKYFMGDNNVKYVWNGESYQKLLR